MDATIETWRDQLLRIVATVTAMIAAAPLPRAAWRRAARLLLPAESATRRLLVLMARGLVVKHRRARSARPFPVGLPAGHARGAFSLAEPLKRFPRRRVRATAMPRISVPGLVAPAPLPLPRPDPAGNCAALTRRLGALRRTLDDLPRAARRMANWQARQRVLMAAPPADIGKKARRRFSRISPLRPGRPPGHRQRGVDAVDAVLAALHARAQATPPDTS